MTAFVTAGAGFLLAVLWFDLMFDVQVLRRATAATLPEEVLASISAYYRRVTTAARPMNLLIAAVMAATLAAIVAQIAAGDAPAWVGWSSLALAAAAILTALVHTVPAPSASARERTPSRSQSAARALDLPRPHALPRGDRRAAHDPARMGLG